MSLIIPNERFDLPVFFEDWDRPIYPSDLNINDSLVPDLYFHADGRGNRNQKSGFLNESLGAGVRCLDNGYYFDGSNGATITLSDAIFLASGYTIIFDVMPTAVGGVLLGNTDAGVTSYGAYFQSDRVYHRNSQAFDSQINERPLINERAVFGFSSFVGGATYFRRTVGRTFYNEYMGSTLSGGSFAFDTIGGHASSFFYTGYLYSISIYRRALAFDHMQRILSRPYQFLIPA